MPTCLYCDEDLYKHTSLTHFLGNDCLCLDCRKKMRPKEINFNLEGLKIKSLYPYESEYKSILIGYKEGLDEALYPLFLRPYLTYLRLIYHGFSITTIPSSRSKLAFRAFDHMKLIVSELRLPYIETMRSLKDINQSQKNYEERKKMRHNFELINRDLPKKLLIIDDVITSGSSLLGAYDILKPHTQKIEALALSYSSNWESSHKINTNV